MSNQPEQKNNRLKTIGLIVLITLLGKVLGLVRDMLLGHNFAIGMESTAFQVASRIPRTFFDAIFASAISASFIPVFNDRLEKHGKEDAFQLSRAFFTWVGLLTAVFSALGIFFAEPIVALLADGFDAPTTALCAALLRILFPSVFFTGIAFSMVGVLQSMGQFNVPAAMSTLSNGVIIFYYLFLCDRFGIWGLAVVFLISWAAQALIQVPWLRKYGFRYRPTLIHPGLKDTFRLMLPVMVSTWIQPVNQLISTRFATHLFQGTGASAMDYANTLYTMLASILALSIANVLFPEMSRLSTAGKEEELGELIASNVRGMLFLILPLSAGLALLSTPIVRLLYEWKSWDSFSTAITSRALACMSLGMMGYGVQTILSRAFYARQNGRLPLISGVVSIAINLVLCILLADRFDVAGLSLATSLSATAAALILLIPTARRSPAHWGRSFLSAIFRMAICTGVMSIGVYFLHSRMVASMADSLITRVLVIGIPTVFGVILYFTAALMLRLDEISVVKKLLKLK